MKYLSFILLASVFALLLFSCSDDMAHNPQDIVFPDSNVSFQAHVQPVIAYNCSYTGCHSNESQAGGIIITDYYSYMVALSGGFVIAGNPDGSRLVQIIENPTYHTPYILWNLNANHKAGIRKWIEEGAKNN